MCAYACVCVRACLRATTCVRGARRGAEDGRRRAPLQPPRRSPHPRPSHRPPPPPPLHAHPAPPLTRVRAAAARARCPQPIDSAALGYCPPPATILDDLSWAKDAEPIINTHFGEGSAIFRCARPPVCVPVHACARAHGARRLAPLCAPLPRYSRWSHHRCLRLAFTFCHTGRARAQRREAGCCPRHSHHTGCKLVLTSCTALHCAQGRERAQRRWPAAARAADAAQPHASVGEGAQSHGAGRV